MEYIFPKDFLWGTATAAAQIEGAAQKDGKAVAVYLKRAFSIRLL